MKSRWLLMVVGVVLVAGLALVANAEPLPPAVKTERTQPPVTALGPDAIMAAGDGIPIAYYDFESDASRSTLETAVDQGINAGNSALARAGLTTTITAGTGAAQQFGRGGPVTGTAAQSDYWPHNSCGDPGTGATSYYQVSLDTSGFSGISLRYDLYAGTTDPSYPYVGTLVSYNGGTSYAVLESGFDPNLNTWVQRSVALSSSGDNNANIRIRFYGYCTNSLYTAGILRVENLTVFATGVTASKTLLDEYQIYTDVTSGLTGNSYIRTGAITFTGAGTTVTLGSDLSVSGSLQVTSGATMSTGGTGDQRSLLEPDLSR